MRNGGDCKLVVLINSGFFQRQRGMVFLSQTLALAGIYWTSFTNGYLYGQMTGMISALQKHDQGIYLSENQIYWIASSVTTVCLVGLVFAALMSEKIGRRWSFILSSAMMATNFIILYNASNMFTFMISRTLAGVAVGALISLCICVTSEYTTSKNRGFYLNMITTVAPAVGTGFGHVLGLLLHWRNVALIGVLFSIISAILPYFWVESPHWLASQGMFAESAGSFIKLHGESPSIVKELRLLIKLEKCRRDSAKSSDILNKLRLAFKKKYFWDIIVLTTVIYAYMAAAGKLIFSVLATVMLEEITGTSDVLLFTLVVDGLIILGSLLSCVLIQKVTMRCLLFSTGSAGNVVLMILSACLYFKRDEVYFRWISVSLLAVYFILINAGPYPVSEALFSELFPLDLKFFCIFFSGIVLIVFSTVSVMLFPLMVTSMGYHGIFLLNVTIMSLSLIYIWIKLPETKERTLQEIEVYIKTKEYDVDEALDNDQMKSLI